MPETTNFPAIDAQGRLLNLPEVDDDESRRREAALRGLDQLLLMGDIDEQTATFDALVKGIDEGRPEDQRKFAE